MKFLFLIFKIIIQPQNELHDRVQARGYYLGSKWIGGRVGSGVKGQVWLGKGQFQ